MDEHLLNASCATSLAQAMEAGGEPACLLMPLFMAYPCCRCAMPGTVCQLCGCCFCSTCDHECDRADTPPDEEEEVVDDVAAPSTGGSEDCCLIDQSVAFNRLQKLLETPSEWVEYETMLWLRCHSLPEVNACYLVDEQGDARRFGSQLGDWCKVMGKVCWHRTGIVVFNLSRRKAYIVEAGATPKPTVALQALRYLRQIPTSLGFIVEGEDDDMVVTLLEGWWRPDESKPVKRTIVRDKLTMTTVRVNRRVDFWWS